MNSADLKNLSKSFRKFNELADSKFQELQDLKNDFDRNVEIYEFPDELRKNLQRTIRLYAMILKYSFELSTLLWRISYDMKVKKSSKRFGFRR